MGNVGCWNRLHFQETWGARKFLQVNGVRVVVGGTYTKGDDGMLYKCVPGNYTFQQAKHTCEADHARLSVVENSVTMKKVHIIV